MLFSFSVGFNSGEILYLRRFIFFLQIFLGMHHLLGKPVIVGDDNLTWTLLKYIEPDDSVSDNVDYESSVENYSRLSVALDVMHECFEPVKEPHTRRDIVEDVIFSRR